VSDITIDQRKQGALEVDFLRVSIQVNHYFLIEDCIILFKNLEHPGWLLLFNQAFVDLVSCPRRMGAKHCHDGGSVCIINVLNELGFQRLK
jgi:hypothetical protein